MDISSCCDVEHEKSETEQIYLPMMFVHFLCRSRKSALASLSSRNKKAALSHARELKLANEAREKCTSLLNRVEEVLSVIANAESTKKVEFMDKDLCFNLVSSFNRGGGLNRHEIRSCKS